MTTSRLTRNISLAAALGAFGGSVLVLSHLFFTPGKYLLIPYALLVVAMTAVVRAEQLAAFGERFMVCFAAFMIASLALYVAVGASPHAAHIAVLGHAWRVAALAAFGIGVSLPAARLAAPTRNGLALRGEA